jgi:predicted  nucleic acid-binding Zn-ribbon protein
MKAAYTEAASVRRSGFIAQEVEKAAEVSGYQFSGLNKPKNEKDHYSLSYESFVVPMVKAIQELNDKLENVKKENESLKKEIKQLKQTK